jgi:hypothetical protein
VKAARFAVIALAACAFLCAQEPKPGRVTIWVSSAQVRSVEGAAIQVTPATSDPPFTVNTGSIGGVAFDLPPSSYLFTISLSGFEPWSREIAVKSDTHESINVTLQKSEAVLQSMPDVVLHGTPGLLTVTVTDTTGAVAPGAEVTVSSSDKGARTDKVARTDGTAEFEVPPGPYKILVSVKGFKQWSKQLEIAEGQSESVSAVLQVASTSCDPCGPITAIAVDLTTTGVDVSSSLPLQPLEQFPMPSVRPRRRFL